VRELIKRLRALVPAAYSPDLDPTEQAFAKVKVSLRRFEARAHGALVEAMGKTLDAVTTRGTRSFFEHYSYRVAGRLP
jgi:hypothetical protein